MHLQTRGCLSTPHHRWNGTSQINVDDNSVKVGGTQRLTMPDGFVIPLDMQHGLPYLDMRSFTDEEWDDFPHFIINCNDVWDFSALDHKQSDDHHWYDQLPSTPLLFPMFDKEGELHSHLTTQQHDTQPASMDGGSPWLLRMMI